MLHGVLISVQRVCLIRPAPPRATLPAPAVHKRLALHHYATKSREEFALKMVRGSAMKRQR